MRRIEIDEEVYGVLEANARGFMPPNGVLRVLLGIDDKKSVPSSAPLAPSEYISGKLMEQIHDGIIEPGDTLVHHQVRLGNTYRARVEADGWISTEIKRYQSPSAALGDLVGSQISGWGHWVHERSGKTLRELRDSVHPHD
jgi:hypothetical protein